MGEQDAFRVRRATEADGDVIREIAEKNPDGGDVSFAPQFEANPYHIHTSLYPDTTGFIAETPGGEPAGIAFVSSLTTRFAGELHHSAYLNNLVVAADHRNQGLAKRLARERINHAERQHSDDRVVWATIQQGNEPSRAVAESWAEHFTYDTTTLTLEPDPGSADTNDYVIREAHSAELPRIAEQVNEFYADAELFGPYSAAEMEDQLSRSPIDEPVRRYLIALDGGDIVAGADIINMYKAMWISVDGDGDLPPALPDNGEIRPKSVVNPWFADGHTDAARALTTYIRANPNGANRISLNADPTDPFASILIDEFGAVSAKEQTTALRGVEPQSDRPLGKPH